VACRYKLPITFIILNNNGIYSGVTELDSTKAIPPTALTPNAHYEKIIEAFGGKGFCVTKPEELSTTLQQALAETSVPTLVNILINPSGPIPRNVQQSENK
jgi:thiamine pyrophosphate-dependent acetolactate synthase large subunit-like protein